MAHCVISRDIERRQAAGQKLGAAQTRYLRCLARGDADECAYCGIALTDDNRTIDHRVSVLRGGSNHLRNLCLACKPCNSAKGAQDADAFMRARCAAVTLSRSAPSTEASWTVRSTRGPAGSRRCRRWPTWSIIRRPVPDARATRIHGRPRRRWWRMADAASEPQPAEAGALYALPVDRELAAVDRELEKVARLEEAAKTFDEVDRLRQRRGVLMRRRGRRSRELALEDRLDRPEYRLLTLQQAAKVLSISVDYATDLANKGTLPGVVGKVGSQWRVNESLLLEFVTGQGPGTPV